MGTHLPACCGTTYRPGPCFMGSGKKGGAGGQPRSWHASHSASSRTYIYTQHTASHLSKPEPATQICRHEYHIIIISSRIAAAVHARWIVEVVPVYVR
jgi:hypothetical protein